MSGEREPVVYVCPECGSQAVDDGMGALELTCELRGLVEASKEVSWAHAAVIEGVTPKHPNWCADDREEYDARFSRWHSATRELREAFKVFHAKHGQPEERG